MVILLLVFSLFLTSPSWAATYYVKKTGSDANSCATAQNSSTPKLTINSALACLTSPGDMLRIGQGTYVERIIYTSLPVSGTAANPITITKIVGENRPLLQPTVGCYGIQINQARNYITYQDIDIDGQNLTSCTLTQGSSLVSAGSDDGPTGVVFRDMDIGYSQSHNILNGNQLLIERVVVHHAGWYENTIPPPTPGSNGIYGSKMRNSIVRYSTFHNNMCNGLRIYNSRSDIGISADNNIVEYNYAYNNGSHVGLDGTSTCNAQASGAILIEGGAGFLIGDKNNTLRYNISKNPNGLGGRCIYVWASLGGTTGSKIYNNTCTGHTWGIQIASSGIQSTTVRNNWSFGNGNGTSDNYINSGTGTVASNNRTTGSQTDCAPNTSVLTHKASSLCIDAGISVGLPYNGSAPDIGAFETFTFASCEVPTSAASTIRVTFTSNVGLLGSTLTTFTARRNGSNNALTGAATKIGDMIISLPVTTTYVGGDTVDISWASGGLTDGVLIGNTFNQPFVQTLTNQSCTNNAAGASSATFTQVTHKFHGVYGLESTPESLAAEGTLTYNVIKGGGIRVRFAVVCGVSNCDSTGFYLYYSTGGAYTAVPDSFDAGNIAFCGLTYIDPQIPANGVSTTNQLSTAGTFIPGAVVFSANAIPTVNGLNTGYKTELEYCIRFDADATGSYTLRVYQQNGTALDTYTLTPTLVIADSQATGGF